tara:strand:+ start:113 stop:295 length:183 start_codon:yes stop_codon:yes gene_type:complete
MKEKQKSQEEKNKEVARKQWDSWVTDFSNLTPKMSIEEKNNKQNGNSRNGDEDFKGVSNK